ncbi:MAG: type IX secretion system membrane protein PorP/SprF [Bacteroidetes bacterium]|jgi:type IX secretion system PorP/SprF family membrane protein|nr:type IX secretion system membrane protein PorP/SprF [Bacteroidota bacterium]MBL0018558.1 type IX secretion system membrane protein PorP/SprF [Bacteroidota bacterium]
MKRIFIIFTLQFALFASAFAQQDALVSQYMFNGLLLNPAYAGSKEYFSTTLLHRSQWTGWKGAPSTQIFTFHSLLRDKVSGVGLTVSNDHIGVTNRTEISGHYAYHIPLGENAKLAFGLKGGVSNYKAKLNELIYWDTDDQVFNQGVIRNLVPNAGVGAYFYTNKFYAGLSVPQLLSYDPREMFHIGENIATLPHVRRHYYLNVGYVIELSPSVALKPSVLVRYVHGAPIQADLNMNVLLNNMFWIGASWRTGDSFVGMLEFQATKRLRVGYSYDYTLTDISRYSNGSHEIMLGYDFGYKVLKMKSPRYF